MKKRNLFLVIILFLFLFSCKSKNENFILNSVEKEWRLYEMNENSVSPNYCLTLYLVFHRNHTYDIYYKEKGKRHDESTDNIIEQKWNFENPENLYFATFSNLKFKIIHLDNKNFVFTYGKEKYSFVCDECE